jgi:hypothetical protein
MTKPNVGGRPTIYTDDLADDICWRISNGETLTRICKMDGYPAQPTVFRWLQEKEGFRENYTRARLDQADHSADFLVDLGDDVLSGQVTADAARVVADIHKWTAARRAPKKYGDRIDVAQTTTYKTVTDKPLSREEEQAKWRNEFGATIKTDD